MSAKFNQKFNDVSEILSLIYQECLLFDVLCTLSLLSG